MTRGRLPRPLRGARNATYRIAATLSEIQGLRAEVDGLRRELAERPSRDDLTAALATVQRELIEVLQLIRDAEPETRRLLWQIRETDVYEAAFEEPEPLVSVVIPTWRNARQLEERALPSVLAQTYERLEVIVVGDAADDEMEAVVRRAGDERVRYVNLPARGPYPDEPRRRWQVAGGPPANEGLRLAQGRWIAQMDDDDACAPTRIEVLLREARRRRLEFCYGRILQHLPDGSTSVLVEFPPGASKVSLTSSLMHTDMRFIAAELGDALFDIPGDWARVRRMWRVGVRIGMVDDVVLEYWPGTQWVDADRPAG